MSERVKRDWSSAEYRREMSEAHKGKKFSAETRQRMSEAKRGSNSANYGKKLPKETRRKISEALRGKKASNATRRKMSEAHRSEKSYFWQGGTSFEEYGPDFNGALRRAIRERDGHTCQLCGVVENGQAHCCHHIDYDKKNNNRENFTLLCAGCHSRTNGNRAFWTNLFQAQVQLGVGGYA